MDNYKNSALIKEEARRLGFSFCGISKTDFLEEEAPRLERYLKERMNGKMEYLENHFDKRLDPRILVPGAKSVVSLLYNYYPEIQQEEGVPKISKYAYGEDYHFVIKDKLKELTEFIHCEIGEVDGRAFVDSAPVLDKAWAKKSGLGWIGKNGILINKQQGSFFFVAELIIDLELEPDGPIKDYCGTCTACIDACPTEAIIEPHVVDGSKCISYFTIELKEAIPQDYADKFEGWTFGCDICQDVCPWNRFSLIHNEPRFEPRKEILSLTKEEWLDLTDEVFIEIARRSAIKRTKLSGMKRNVLTYKTPH